METSIILTCEQLLSVMPINPTEPTGYRSTFGHTHYATVSYNDIIAKVYLCRQHLPNDNDRFAFSIRYSYNKFRNDTAKNDHKIRDVYEAGIALAKQIVVAEYNYFEEMLRQQETLRQSREDLRRIEAIFQQQEDLRRSREDLCQSR